MFTSSTIQKFSFLLFVLMGLDIVSTKIALSKGFYEHNHIMALVVGNTLLFIAVKALYIIGTIKIFKEIDKMNKYKSISTIGKSLTIIMMIFVVFGNMVTIADAVSFGFPSPYELEYPGRIEVDGSQSYAWIGHNNYNVTNYFTFGGNESSGLEYTAANVFYSNNMVRFAVYDWNHPGRLFLVFSNLDVAYTDSQGTVYENGYYADNVWPLPGCSNCNDLHKIGTVTRLNKNMNGYVDSNGDLNLADGLSIIKFVRASDYTKNIVFTVPTNDFTISTCTGAGCAEYYQVLDEISSFKYYNSSVLHVMIGGAGLWTTSGSRDFSAHLTHIVYIDSAKMYSQVISSYSINSNTAPVYTNTSILLLTSPNNITTDYVLGYLDLNTGNVILVTHNETAFSDICPAFCATIINYNGLQIYGGYAYIASASENKIYRFPANISVASGTGYQQGIIPGQSAPELTYSTSWVRSKYENYYNNSQFTIQYNLNASTLYTDYDISLFATHVLKYTYRVDLINPSGTKVGEYPISPICDNAGAIDILLYPSKIYYCLSSGSFNFNQAADWAYGTYTVKLYEKTTATNADAILSQDSFESGNTSGTLAGTNPIEDTTNRISTGDPTMDNIVYFLTLPAFWGILIFAFVVIAVAWKAPSAVGIVALIISNLEAIIGLWSPYTIYVFLVTWIIAAIFFTLGRDTTTGGSKT